MKGEKPAKSSRFKIGLRGQQIILFLFVSLMPLFVVSLTIKVLGENALKGNVGESLVLLAQEKLYRIDRAISQKIANIRGELPNIREAVARSNSANGEEVIFLTVWARLEDSIRLLEAFAGYKSEVTIANADGYVLRSNNPRLDYDARKLVPHQVSHTDWWQRAYNNGIGYQLVSDIMYDSTEEVHLLSVVLPIGIGTERSPTGTGNSAVGVLKTVLFLPELASLVEPLPDMKGTYTILTTQSGKIIAAPSESRYRIDSYIDMSYAAEGAIIEAKKGADGKYYGYEAEGETDVFDEARVYGWARTQPSILEPWKVQQNFSNWIVFISRPISAAYAAIVKLNQYIFYLTLASSIIVVLIAWSVAQRITTPIMQVAQAAHRIGQGEFEREISVNSDTEVGILAEAFNEMRRNLKAAVEKLTQEEKKLTAIVDNLGEGLVVVDTAGRVLYVNLVAERLLNLGHTSDYENFASVDTTTGKIHWTKQTAADENSTAEHNQRHSERTSVTLTVNMKVLASSQREETQNQTVIVEVMELASNLPAKHRKDASGKALHIEEPYENAENAGEDSKILRIVTSHFADENNNIAGTVYVFDDVTHEYEIDRMKSEFVSLASHELRTPLTSIIGFISLILDGKTGKINEKQREGLSRAHRQSKRLAALIEDLLDVSRIEAGRIEMKQEQVLMAKIAQRRIEELRPQADEKAITLCMNAPPNLPHSIGDADRIGQVFINLIGNAIKFTPLNGKVAVRISRIAQRDIEVLLKRAPAVVADWHRKNGNVTDVFHVEVIDTGPGIPIEEREQVFDKFRQLGSVQTRQQGGTGLGLSIASGIVEAHGGKLWVDTGDNGQGCNFQFFIPVLCV